MSPKTRRLGDLYQFGKLVAVPDPEGEPIEVWVQKINSVELDEVFRRANAAKARLLSARSDHDSDAYQEAVAEALTVEGREAMIDHLLRPEELRVNAAREAELAAEDEWAEDEYLQGLRDAWNQGLRDEWLKDPEDPEAARVYQELQRFSAKLEETVSEEFEMLRGSYEDTSDEELFEDVTKAILGFNANTLWVDEYNRHEVYLGTREPDHHKKRYFSSRAEVDDLAPQVLGALLREFELIRVNVFEGKGLREIPASSPQSEQPAEEETSDSSSLMVATT